MSCSVVTSAVIITELHFIVYDGNYALLITDDTCIETTLCCCSLCVFHCLLVSTAILIRSNLCILINAYMLKYCL